MKVTGAMGMAVVIALLSLSNTHAFGHSHRCGHQQPRPSLHHRLWNNPTVQRVASLPLFPLEYASEQASRLLDFFDLDPAEQNDATCGGCMRHDQNAKPDLSDHKQLGITEDNDRGDTIREQTELNEQESHPMLDNKNKRRMNLVDIAHEWNDWMKQMDWDGNEVTFYPFLTNDEEREANAESDHEHRYSEMLKKKEELEKKLQEEKEAIRQLEQNIENERRLQKQREEQKRIELERQREEERQKRKQQERFEREKIENEQRELEGKIRKEQERLRQLKEQQELLRQRRMGNKPSNQAAENKRDTIHRHRDETRRGHRQQHGHFDGSHTGDQRRQEIHRPTPKTELFSLQVPEGYSPRDIKVRSVGPEVKIEGKRVCGCDESCVLKEFSRAFKLPRGLATQSLQAKFYGNGYLSIEGDTQHPVPEFVDTNVKVTRVGLFEDAENIKDRLQCLRTKSGFKLSKMDGNTGQTYHFKDQEQDRRYKGFDEEREDDGVTIEVVDE